MSVVSRTHGVQRLELQGCAAEGLRHASTEDDARHRQVKMGRNLGRGNEGDGQSGGHDDEQAHHALTSTCPMWPSALPTVDSNRWAVLLAPPMAPGILNTMNSDARANR